jgi:hypothetical protein
MRKRKPPARRARMSLVVANQATPTPPVVIERLKDGQRNHRIAPPPGWSEKRLRRAVDLAVAGSRYAEAQCTKLSAEERPPVELTPRLSGSGK